MQGGGQEFEPPRLHQPTRLQAADRGGTLAHERRDPPATAATLSEYGEPDPRNPITATPDDRPPIGLTHQADFVAGTGSPAPPPTHLPDVGPFAAMPRRIGTKGRPSGRRPQRPRPWRGRLSGRRTLPIE